MKNYLRTAAAALMCLAVTAVAADDKKAMKDHIAMENGKVVCMVGGKSEPLTETKTLDNGTMVMADGTVKMKDGKTEMLKDGDAITMDGKITKHKKVMKEKKGDK